MDVTQIQRQYVSFGNSMYREGYVSDQFTQLQKLADESHPDFVMEITTIFFDDFEEILQSLTNAMEEPITNFDQVTELIHKLKGSCCSYGATKVKNLCVVLQNYSEEHSLQACIACLHRVKEEYDVVKSKLETLLEMQDQIMEAGGVVPLIE